MSQDKAICRGSSLMNRSIDEKSSDIHVALCAYSITSAISRGIGIRIEGLDVASLLRSLKLAHVSPPNSTAVNSPQTEVVRGVGWREICAENHELGDAALRLAIKYGYLDDVNAGSHSCAGYPT